MSAEDPDGRDTLRQELRGTIIVAVALVGILAAGWIGTRLVARDTATLGPGVTITYGPGWGENVIGPMGVWSHSRRIGQSVLNVSPRWESESLEELLGVYRREVLDVRLPQAVHDDPVMTEHAAGAALIQRWSARDPDGTLYRAELLVVASGTTGVILDARWPENEDPDVVAEIRRVMSSLQIEPLVP